MSGGEFTAYKSLSLPTAPGVANIEEGNVSFNMDPLSLRNSLSLAHLRIVICGEVYKSRCDAMSNYLNRSHLITIQHRLSPI